MTRTTHVSVFPAISGSDRARRARAALLASTLLIALPGLSMAQELPSGGTVASGTASIGTPAPGSMVIRQGSERAVVNWDSFSIGGGGRVDIRQPGTSSAILNRVTGDTTSRIHGALTANGQVYVVNPNGILIGRGGTVNTGGGFVASTLDISDQDFNAGNPSFRGNGASAGVTNLGSITVGRGGYAALIGGRVDNAGTITAPLGRIGLGAGERVTLDLSGDRFLMVALPSEDDGDDSALVKNSGRLSADGGLIEMKAATARNAARNAINLSGVAEARSVSMRNGAIVLGGGDGGSVRVSGRVSTAAPRQTAPDPRLATSQRPPRQTGGQIQMTGAQIMLLGALLDARGDGGGGTIRIGGDFAGKGILPRARTVSADADTRILADALTQGNGGRIVLWSDRRTDFHGNISARGGETGGNGGFAEVSSAGDVRYRGRADLRAPRGAAGMLLIDPTNIILSGDEDATIFTADAEEQLELSDLTLDTSAPPYGGDGSDLGNITIGDALSWDSGNSLILRADNNISVQSSVTAVNGGLDLGAVNSIVFLDDVSITVSALTMQATGIFSLGADFIETGAAGSVSADIFALNGGSWEQRGPALSPFEVGDFRLAGAGFLRVAGGTGTTADPYLLTDIYGLQGMDSGAIFDTAAMLDSHFALANDIDASGTSGWNRDDSLGGFAGFDPIGGAEESFTGSLDGRGNSIDQLFIGNLRFASGLFHNTGGAEIRDLSLTGLDISAVGQAGGVIVNADDTVLENVSASGSLTLDEVFGFGVAGGLVGNMSGGEIIDSSADVDILIGNPGDGFGTLIAGGLVGETSGTISGSSATGSITATGGPGSDTEIIVGGFVGENFGEISDSFATGSVTASAEAEFSPVIRAGGFAGRSRFDTLISRARATGAVEVSSNHPARVGGFIGELNGTIIDARADGDVSFTRIGTIQNSFSDSELGGVGGFAGYHDVSLPDVGTMIRTAAHGDVTVTGGPLPVDVGGHTGRNVLGDIIDSYADGNVTSSSSDVQRVGGLVGFAGGGEITNTYASGAVVATGAGVTQVGGLIGLNSGATVTASFYDQGRTGQAPNGAVSAYGQAISTATFQDTAAFLALAEAQGWDFANVWAPGDSTAHPAIYTIDNVIFARPDAVTLQYGSAETTGTTGTVYGGPSVYVFGPDGDSLDASSVFDRLNFPSRNVGTGQFTLAATSLTSNLGQTYRIVDLPTDYRITPAPLRIVVDDQTKTYGRGFGFGGDEFTRSRLFYSDSVSGIDLASAGAGPRASVGSYAIRGSNATGSGLSNYDITYVDGTMTVNPARLIITANDQTKPFGDSFFFNGTEFSATGLMAWDGIDRVDLTSAGAAAGAPATTYGIDGADASGIGLGNYLISYMPGTMTVTPGGPAYTDNIPRPVLIPASDLPNPQDTINFDPTAPAAAASSTTAAASQVILAARNSASETLAQVDQFAAVLEIAAQACSQSDADVSRYLACLSDALDDFANKLDEISTDLPPGMENVAEIVRDARRNIDSARARAESRLATATTAAEREAIRRDAIGEARVAIASASAEIRQAIALVRADDPELASIQAATINRVSDAVDSVGIELSRAVGL